MAVGVIGYQRPVVREKEDSDLDKALGLAKLLEAGTSIYKNVAPAPVDQLKVEQLAKARGEAAAIDRRNKGIVTPEEELDLFKTFEPVKDKGLAELIRQRQNPDGTLSELLLKKRPDPLLPAKAEVIEQTKIKNQQDIDQAKREKTPAGKLEKAGADKAQKIGFIASGFESLGQYRKEFDSGSRQSRVTSETPIIGSVVSDSPIDQYRTKLEEAIGRMASGGAINKEEEARFRGMLPRAGDKDEDAIRKMTALEKEFELKLAAYGFSRKELAEASPAFKDLAGPQIDPKIEAYAKQHNLKYDKAEQLLKARGYGAK